MKLLLGDCKEKLKELEDNSIDAIVTDPPYGLSFMGKKWDYDVPSVDIWKECLRVLKPGGYLLSFAGTRTQHRMAVNIEDAGFEIRDMIAWVYGSGFPKSLNIGKAVDKLQGNEREESGEYQFPDGLKRNSLNDKGTNQCNRNNGNAIPKNYMQTKGTSEFEGWGTATKPAVEPVSVCTKPLPVSLIFCILGIDLTNKITNLCQKQNVNVSDVETTLKSIQALLEKAGVNTVHENARTLSWENIENVAIAATSFTLQEPTLKEPTGESREVSAHKSAKQSGKNNLQENSIPTGKVEGLREKMGTLLSILATRNIDSNTILLWKSILEDTLKKANTFTTEMALEVIITWKTYNYLLSANTPSFTGPSKEVKPSLSPIVMSRKPLGEKTVAENCLKWGVGGINIDGCRVGTEKRVPGSLPNPENKGQIFNRDKGKTLQDSGHNPNIGRFPANLIHDNSEEVRECFPETKSQGHWSKTKTTGFGEFGNGSSEYLGVGEKDKEGGNASRFFKTCEFAEGEAYKVPTGRFPANLIHDGSDEVVGLFPQTKGGTAVRRNKGIVASKNVKFNADDPNNREDVCFGDSGSASRFFYCAKASKRERNIGCEGLEESIVNDGRETDIDNAFQRGITLRKNTHPTVKPIALMEYLVKLVSREGQVVLDPFMGSGTTGMACKKLDRDFIGIEMMPEYMEIAKARIEGVKKGEQLNML